VSKKRKAKGSKQKARMQRRASGGAVPVQVVDSGMNRLLAASQRAGFTRHTEPEWVKRSVAQLTADRARYGEAATLAELEALVCERFEPVFADEEERNSFWAGAIAEGLIEAAGTTLAGTGDEAERLGAWYLLGGLASCLGEPLSGRALARMGKARKKIPAELASKAPSWIGKSMSCTGEVWTAANAYRDEFGLFATFTDPADGAERVYAIGFDDSGFPRVGFAGDFADLESAASAWAAYAGLESPVPSPVTDTAELAFTAGRDDPLDTPGPVPHDSVRSEFFRLERRLADVLGAVERRDGAGIPAPGARFTPEAMRAEIDRFTAWASTQGIEIADDNDAAIIVDEWCGISAPGTEHSISPKRIEYSCGLIADQYLPDYAQAAFALLPHWYRYCAEQTGLGQDAVERAIAATPVSVEAAREALHRRDRERWSDDDAE
jgi:hypothetical protein